MSEWFRAFFCHTRSVLILLPLLTRYPASGFMEILKKNNPLFQRDFIIFFIRPPLAGWAQSDVQHDQNTPYNRIGLDLVPLPL